MLLSYHGGVTNLTRMILCGVEALVHIIHDIIMTSGCFLFALMDGRLENLFGQVVLITYVTT